VIYDQRNRRYFAREELTARLKSHTPTVMPPAVATRNMTEREKRMVELAEYEAWASKHYGRRPRYMKTGIVFEPCGSGSYSDVARNIFYTIGEDE
jgi:hypothetical protein